jgi:hypothetical protein
VGRQVAHPLDLLGAIDRGQRFVVAPLHPGHTALAEQYDQSVSVRDQQFCLVRHGPDP